MLENIAAAPADPILGLNDKFLSDPRSHKINLGVGVYKDENGNTPVLNSVKQAERRLLEAENSKPPITRWRFSNCCSAMARR
jgi:aspartate aminotransferase